MSQATDLKQLEERKRDLAYDPVARWKHIQEAITWAEANMAPENRRNRPRQPRIVQTFSEKES